MQSSGQGIGRDAPPDSTPASQFSIEELLWLMAPGFETSDPSLRNFGNREAIAEDMQRGSLISAADTEMILNTRRQRDTERQQSRAVQASRASTNPTTARRPSSVANVNQTGNARPSTANLEEELSQQFLGL